MYIGRLYDTKKLYTSFGLGTEKDEIFNLTKGCSIRVQKLKDWSVLINDCWVLGAIHGHRKFELKSNMSGIEYIWNSAGYLIVTAREILGLMHFGYKANKNSKGELIFTCKDRTRATSATLTKYAQLSNKASKSPVAKAQIALFTQNSIYCRLTKIL